MPRLPIIEALLKYRDENNLYFAMPGHKAGRVYENIEEGRVFLNNLISFDLTEVDGLDNFHDADGIIKEAREELSKYYGSRKSYFLVNGSTSGNMIMIFSVFNENDKIIVERNCHKSIYNSIILRKLRPIYIKNKVSNIYDAPFSIDKEHLLSMIEKNKDAKGIVLTYPNYYGICSDLKEIIEKAREYNIKILIDGAHGAHFGASDGLPKSAVKLGVDIIVHSAHKTLPSLTQTSFLHVNSEELIDKVDYYTSIFSTTSPSYMFMASMDFSRYYLEKYGNSDYTKLINLCEEYRLKINNIGFYHIIGQADILKNIKDDNIYIDKSRYIINLPKGYSGHKLLDYLKLNKIQGEMSDHRNIILIFGTNNNREDFESLYQALKKCDVNKLKDRYTSIKNIEIPEMLLLPWEAREREMEICSLDDSLGRACGKAIIPYPPGIPIIMPGEIISKEIIDIINYYKNNKVKLLGLDSDNIILLK